MKPLTGFAAAVLALTLAAGTAWFAPGPGSEMRSGASSALVDHRYADGETAYFEIARFEDRIADSRQPAQAEWKDGYGGMGKIDGFVILLLVLLVLYGLGDHSHRKS